MDCTFEKLDKNYKKEVADILNYYIENTTAAIQKVIKKYYHF